MGKKTRLMCFVFTQTLSNTTVQLHPKPRKLSHSFSERRSAWAGPCSQPLDVPIPRKRDVPARGRHACPPLPPEMLCCRLVPRSQFACPRSPFARPEISVHSGPHSTQDLAIRVEKVVFFALLIYLTLDFLLILSQVLILLCRQPPICTLNQRDKTRLLMVSIIAKIFTCIPIMA